MEKKWWNNSFVNKRDFLLEEYHNLELTLEDIMLLMMIDYHQQKHYHIDTKKLALSLNKNENKVQEHLSQLVSDGWISMEFTNKELVYNMDAIFEKKPIRQQIKSIFDLFEEHFARPLTGNEIKKLSTWSVTYSKEKIEGALRQAIVYKHLNFKYIETILET